MKILTLNRTVRFQSFSQGALFAGKDLVCFTLERPWIGNKRNVSCIPAGMYECVKETHSKLGTVLRVNGVPKRAGIIIHKANNVDQLQGCIAPGLYFDVMDFKLSIMSSGLALFRILDHVDENGKVGLDVVDFEEKS